jgi:hypothetical protein
LPCRAGLDPPGMRNYPGRIGPAATRSEQASVGVWNLSIDRTAKMAVITESDRLVIREWTEADADAALAICTSGCSSP